MHSFSTFPQPAQFTPAILNSPHLVQSRSPSFNSLGLVQVHCSVGRWQPEQISSGAGFPHLLQNFTGLSFVTVLFASASDGFTGLCLFTTNCRITTPMTMTPITARTIPKIGGPEVEASGAGVDVVGEA
jgi:hypothetical protein